MRLLTIISGGMLIMTSLFCYANPGETFLPLAFVLGMAMILTGIVQCIAYWWGRDNRRDNNGWIFAEALMTLILGILVLTSLIAADAAIPMVFGLWVIFSGVLRIVVATMIDPKAKKANFVWTMATGLVSTVTGIYAFVNPLIANLNIAVLLGILFMIQGICTMELGIHMPHEKKEKAKKPKARAIKIQIKKPAKKKVDKSKDILNVITPVNIDTDNLNEADVKKYMTEEIKIDDIRAALEFNFGGQDNAETAGTEEHVIETISDADVEEPSVDADAEELSIDADVEEPSADTAINTEDEEQKK